jgi:hypothetical protein
MELIKQSALNLFSILWSVRPSELAIASILVPSTIVISFWILDFLKPFIIAIGCLFGLLFGAIAIVKTGLKLKRSKIS